MPSRGRRYLRDVVDGQSFGPEELQDGPKVFPLAVQEVMPLRILGELGRPAEPLGQLGLGVLGERADAGAEPLAPHVQVHHAHVLRTKTKNDEPQDFLSLHTFDLRKIPCPGFGVHVIKDDSLAN